MILVKMCVTVKEEIVPSELVLRGPQRGNVVPGIQSATKPLPTAAAPRPGPLVLSSPGIFAYYSSVLLSVPELVVSSFFFFLFPFPPAIFPSIMVYFHSLKESLFRLSWH